MLTGAGHIEMNAVRVIFKLGFPVFIKRIGQLLGFISLKAQAYCNAAHDHHKSWQILTIALFGCADEMLAEYVRYCKVAGREPTVKGFDSWAMLVPNKNFKFMYVFVFKYLLSVYSKTMGTLYYWTK